MQGSPKISVIIPVYNCDKYVEEAVESVINQAYHNIHVVLVNDGSTDSSPEICDRYASQNERVHAIHQQNGGVSKARNTGIDYVLEHFTDTDYIAFLDADDKWCADFLSVDIITILKRGIDLLGFQSCNANNTLTRSTHPKSLVEGLYPGDHTNVWLHSSHHFASMLYAADLLRSYHLRFKEQLKSSEDVIFRMQCIYLAKNMQLVNRPLYLYRHSASSAVHTRKYGIPYFTPIIDSWIDSDNSMASFESETRAPLWEGRAMAAVCIVDMVEEHYQRFGNKRSLEQLFRERPEYMDLLNSPFAHNRPDSGLRWQKMQAHPIRFRLQCYARGIISSTVRTLYLLLMRIPLIATLLDKKRYPIAL